MAKRYNLTLTSDLAEKLEKLTRDHNSTITKITKLESNTSETEFIRMLILEDYKKTYEKKSR